MGKTDQDSRDMPCDLVTLFLPSTALEVSAHPRGLRTRCLRFAAALTVPATQNSLSGGGPRPYRPRFAQ